MHNLVTNGSEDRAECGVQQSLAFVVAVMHRSVSHCEYARVILVSIASATLRLVTALGESAHFALSPKDRSGIASEPLLLFFSKQILEQFYQSNRSVNHHLSRKYILIASAK